MSADNWKQCPECLEEFKKADPIGKAKKRYGKIPLDEYEYELDEAMKKAPPEQSLREDYEFFLDGFCLEISYSCKCTTCGFTFSFNKKIQVPH